VFLDSILSLIAVFLNSFLICFAAVGNLIKITPTSERLSKQRSELAKITFPSHPDGFILPIDYGIRVKGLIIEKCRYMDSKKLPLWLVFENADDGAPPVYVIFKVGDDLRQDILTLQMISLMYEQIKLSHMQLDLLMLPYAVVATGDEIGMLEVVMNADTVANIQRECGGFRGAFKEDPMLLWLTKSKPQELPIDTVKETFMLSCAGYCVVTYILGIGDRHNDNIMVTRTGNFFHIDFGHFLGNFKEKFGVKRERAPFVFTPDLAFVMDGKGSPMYQKFEETCCRVYCELRTEANKYISLFSLMLSTGLPELQSLDDLKCAKFIKMLSGFCSESPSVFQVAPRCFLCSEN
jgi:phosphatidylinositol-4,5-bisphosphate 3-kinase